ncbi:MAG: hypothetical protein QOC68_2225 [Solirubrobacteraceae bacterium]|nr:hypothetical protein [Solirubrobacteraceae bacterium]
MTLRSALALALLAALASPAPGGAAPPGRLPGLVRGLSDASYFNSPDPAVRALGLQRTRQAAGRFVRIQLSWSYVTRKASTPELARDPGWDGYEFDYVDRIVREAVAAGLEPLVVVKNAPAQFEAPRRWRFAPRGTWAPSPAAYGDFAVAVARRYSGEWPDRRHPGATLPRVRYWQAWNEPNHPAYLQPQWIAQDGRWLPYSPTHYRRMLVAFDAGIHAWQPDAVVLTAGTAPIGEADGVGRMPPVRFWQSFFCLGRPPALSPSPCPSPARFDVFAHHPFSVGDPDRARRPPDDASIADLHRLLRILHAAERTGRAGGAVPHPVWVTELNWDSRPPDPKGLPAALQRRWIARALYRMSAEGVQAVFWHFITDPPDPRHPAGLWHDDDPRGRAFGRPKPALAAFRFPFVAIRGTEARVRVWGLLPGPGATRAAIDRRVHRRWRRVGSVAVSAAGVLEGELAVRGSAVLRARAGFTVSPAWRVGPG